MSVTEQDLPVLDWTAFEAPAPARKVCGSAVSGPDRVCLITDDEPNIRTLLSLFLNDVA
jgi:hypothetical protein